MFRLFAEPTLGPPAYNNRNNIDADWSGDHVANGGHHGGLRILGSGEFSGNGIVTNLGSLTAAASADNSPQATRETALHRLLLVLRHA